MILNDRLFGLIDLIKTEPAVLCKTHKGISKRQLEV
jgi:hypothetical protein